MAAALNVSQAENKTSSLFSLNIFPILPIVVVLPTPFTPETKITFKLFFFSKNLINSIE